MQEKLNKLWLTILVVVFLLLATIPFGFDPSMLTFLLGQYIVTPLLVFQIIVWIFFRKK